MLLDGDGLPSKTYVRREGFFSRPPGKTIRKHPFWALTTLIVLLLLFSSGCDLIVTSDNPGGGTTTLTLQNATGYDLVYVSWVSQDGTSYNFESGNVYDEAATAWLPGMPDGSQTTVNLNAGASPIHFYFADGGVEQRTVEIITVGPGDNAQVTLNTWTPVIN